MNIIENYIPLFWKNLGSFISTLFMLPITLLGQPDGLIFPYQNLHVHGPTVVELPDGSILAAWFEGSGERWADDVKIMGAVNRIMKKVGPHHLKWQM